VITGARTPPARCSERAALRMDNCLALRTVEAMCLAAPNLISREIPAASRLQPRPLECYEPDRSGRRKPELVLPVFCRDMDKNTFFHKFLPK